MKAALIVIVAGLASGGCASPSGQKIKGTPPVVLTKVPGTDQVKVTLLPEAAKRLGVTTAPVRRADGIGEKRRYSGEVLSVIKNLDATFVRVEMPESDRQKLLPQQPAFVIPLARAGHRGRIKAKPVSDPARFGLYAQPGTAYYETRSSEGDLAVPQLVFVELALSGEKAKTIVPYSAVLYDPKGGEWVYTSPEPLVYLRQRVEIGSVVDDDVFLVAGLAEGTAVVTAGAAELFGAECGVGK